MEGNKIKKIPKKLQETLSQEAIELLKIAIPFFLEDPRHLALWLIGMIRIIQKDFEKGSREFFTIYPAMKQYNLSKILEEAIHFERVVRLYAETKFAEEFQMYYLPILDSVREEKRNIQVKYPQNVITTANAWLQWNREPLDLWERDEFLKKLQWDIYFRIYQLETAACIAVNPHRYNQLENIIGILARKTRYAEYTATITTKHEVLIQNGKGTAWRSIWEQNRDKKEESS